MSTTTNLDTLKINYLTQAQYDRAVSGGTINPDELYLTPDDGSSGAAKNVWFGTTDVGGSTAVKTVTTTTGDFTLDEGNILVIASTAGSFTASDTQLQLNVDSTGAKLVYSTVNSATSGIFTLSDFYVARVFVIVYINGHFTVANYRLVTQTDNPGYVKYLTDSTVSTRGRSSGAAATPKAVKTAYDLAASKCTMAEVEAYIATLNRNGVSY